MIALVTGLVLIGMAPVIHAIGYARGQEDQIRRCEGNGHEEAGRTDG